jgi:prophage maintenance system killer protein
MRYLTVQDMLWISLQVVGRPQKFQYAKLEEATFTQYIYGESQAPIEHAIRFLTGWPRHKPFAEANERIGLVAFLAFLRMNGLRLDNLGAAAWYETAGKNPDQARSQLVENFDHHEAEKTTRQILDSVLEELGVVASPV